MKTLLCVIILCSILPSCNNPQPYNRGYHPYPHSSQPYPRTYWNPA